MSFQKYLMTEKGRTAVLITSHVTASVIGSSYILLHTWGAEKYKNIIHLYQNGFPRPVNINVLKKANEVVQEMKLPEKFQDGIRFFSIFGFDIGYIGSSKTRPGAFVGIPYNFSYETLVDVERGSIVVENESVSWSSDDGQLLQNSLILSDNAKKFAIARQISYLDSYYIYLYALIHGGTLTTYSLGSHLANNLFYGFKRPKSFRIFLYSMIGTFCFGLWSMCNDSLSRYYDRNADQRACSLGIDYARGGVEFYSKMLQRNIGLRGLAKKGESTYTLYGDNIEFFRRRTVPISERKKNAENVVKSYLEKQMN